MNLLPTHLVNGVRVTGHPPDAERLRVMAARADADDVAYDAAMDAAKPLVTGPAHKRDDAYYRVRVQCRETGERWESISACAKALGVHGGSVQHAMRAGRVLRGRLLLVVRQPKGRGASVRRISDGKVFRFVADVLAVDADDPARDREHSRFIRAVRTKQPYRGELYEYVDATQQKPRKARRKHDDQAVFKMRIGEGVGDRQSRRVCWNRSA